MPDTIVLVAEESTNIDVTTYRGSAALADLTRMSQADVFDQDANEEGLQRDLSRKHATDAYDYVARPAEKAFPRMYPEVLLNVRDRAVVDVEVLSSTEVEPGGRMFRVAKLTVDLDKIAKARTPKISRVDGNHRLQFGAGDGKDREPLGVQVPFALTIGLSRDQERSVFLDVNANQKGLNSSHLAYMRTRLAAEDVELQRRPARVYAQRLTIDPASPWHGLVNLGGSKAGAKAKGLAHPVTFVALEGACKRLLRSQYLQTLMSDPNMQYGMVRNYWAAVAQTWPEAWESPREFYVFKSIGLATLATLGATIIDRAMATQNVEIDDLARDLAKVKDRYNWHRDAEGDTGLAGYSGNRAALLLAGELAAELPKLPKGQEPAAA